MSDNTGNYVEFEELIAELHEDGNQKIISADTVLSAKAVDVGGDIYTFTGGTPQLNDVVYQGGELGLVIAFPSGSTIRVRKTGAANTVVNGPAKFVRSSQLTKRRATALITGYMQFVDRATRNFFNKRPGIFSLEGDNGPTMWLPVPIIAIDKIVINSTTTELFEGEGRDFIAFMGRTAPADDRKNPMIKLGMGRGRDSIFNSAVSNRIFARGTMTQLHGSFGYLEADGTTPERIKYAMKLLIFKEMNKPSSTLGSSGQVSAGPLRRIKVDLHEKEFFASPAAESDKKAVLSGIMEVDTILAQYKSPLLVSGSIPRFAHSLAGSQRVRL